MVTFSDKSQFNRAHQTIKDLRLATRGNWSGDIVFIAIDWDPPESWCTTYKVQVVKFPRIDTSVHIAALERYPVIPKTEKRYSKLVVWEKLHIFDPFFKKWDRLVYFDGGMRILDDVKYILELPWQEKFIAHDDCHNSTTRNFRLLLDSTNMSDLVTEVTEKYNIDLDGKFFLNCFWIMDTKLPITCDDLYEALKYPIWGTQEMSLMNAVIHSKMKVWSSLPLKASNGKFLFDWTEDGRPWEMLCMMKYPTKIKFDDY